MYLVDTSVWISYMRDEETGATDYLTEIEERGHPVGITGVICQEVLQGAASQAKFDYLAKSMSSQTFYHPHDLVENYREAARIHFDCRRAGVAIRSAADCLIARVAIEHDVPLLHDDNDFDRMAEVVPELELA